MLKVKDTYLSKILLGDIGMHTAKSIIDGGVLDQIIVWGSGNPGLDEDGDGNPEPGRSSGNYTHCFIVSQVPDPEAEVEIVRKDKKTGREIYRVKDKKLAGIKVHSTWPVVIEEPIDWSEDHFELWRVRDVSKHYWSKTPRKLPSYIPNVIDWAINRTGRIYNIAEFLTFGLFRFSHSWKCSNFVSEAYYQATEFTDKPKILTPSGRFDSFVTPNDLINSRQLICLFKNY